MEAQAIKEGDWVKVPAAKRRPWKENQGKVTLVREPFCMVRVTHGGRSYNIPYRICDVEKM